MGQDDKEENSDASSWAYSTSTSSSDADNDDSTTGISAFSTDPGQNIGDRPLSNWGDEPRIDDSPAVKSWSIWNTIARLFGAPRSS